MTASRKPQPKNQARVLQAMRLLHEADENGAELFSFGAIMNCVLLNCLGRRPSEGQVIGALRALEARGRVERVEIEGMGGGLYLYRRVS